MAFYRQIAVNSGIKCSKVECANNTGLIAYNESLFKLSVHYANKLEKSTYQHFIMTKFWTV